MEDTETQVTTLDHASRSSIDLSRDAKGVYRWGIKIYWDVDFAASAEDRERARQDVVAELEAVDAMLRDRWA